MRSRGPALVATAVISAGTFYLSRTNDVSNVIHHHRHVVAIVASPSADPDATPSALPLTDALTIYYCTLDGHTLAPWQVRLGEARDVKSVAYLAAVKAVAGPADTIRAIRFPAGTSVKSVSVADDMATVDFSAGVEETSAGGFAEIGEFKALIWTLTDLPHIKRVRIRVDGATLPTLPGGHLELDEPLSRSDF